MKEKLKQPVKPYIELDGGYAACPICHAEVDPYEDCPKCQQIIDWSWFRKK